MRLTRVTVALATALLATVACEDGSGPEGSPSDFEVQVYVERDDSVGMTPGDSPVPSLVTVASNFDDVVLTDSTGADGRVTFLQLPAGAYTVTHAPTHPSSALELRGSASQTVAAPFAGDTVLTRFVYVETPGGIAGVAFRDDDGSGGFEAGADSTFEGVIVRAFAGADTLSDAVAADTTDADGEYALTELASGDYMLHAQPLGGTAIVGANPRPVTVAAGETATQDLEFTGDPTGVVIPIADARAATDGTNVKVRGVVTAGQGAYRDDSFYVQDASGGIFVFGVDSELGLALGDSVQVYGAREETREEVLIIAAQVVELGTGTVPDPKTVTASDINAGAFQGELATLVATVDSIVPVLGGFAVWTHDATADAVVFVDDDTGVADTAFTVAAEQTVTGILAVYDDDDDGTVDAGEYHIKPRGVDDVD